MVSLPWSLTDVMDEASAEIRKLFNEMDEDNSGFVDEEEVAALAKRLGAPLTKRELAEAMKEVKSKANGFVQQWPLF
jgi:Ca2+-binding EF-hand superfamily protein